MKHILLATDLSDRSDRAFARAAALAEQFGAELRLICAVDEDLSSSLRRGLEREAEAGLREAASAVQSKGVAASWSIVAGRPHAVILQTAAEFAYDLVVLGTHRHDAFSDLFVGTTVERVIRYGRRPVLVVREPVRGAYGEVLVGVDFSPSSDLALRFALRGAPQAEFRVVHAFETPFPGFLPREGYAPEIRRERQAQLDELIARSASAAGQAGASKIVGSVVEGEADAALRRMIADRKPDLLTLGTHGRTGVAHAILGSMAERFLSHPPCDVLAVRA